MANTYEFMLRVEVSDLGIELFRIVQALAEGVDVNRYDAKAVGFGSEHWSRCFGAYVSSFRHIVDYSFSAASGVESVFMHGVTKHPEDIEGIFTAFQPYVDPDMCEYMGFVISECNGVAVHINFDSDIPNMFVD